MKREKKNNLKLGAFVTGAFVLFAILIYNIGSTTNFFGSNLKLSTVFKNVKGLRPGNIVRYAGINIGSVDNLLFIGDSVVQVDMLLEKRVKQFLKNDAIATLGTDGLVGDVIVNINPGNSKGALIQDNDFLKSESGMETSEMINALGSTTENLSKITINLLEITDAMKSGKGSLAMLLNDDALASDIKKAVRNLTTTSKNLNALSREVNNSMDKINEGEGLIGYLLKDTTFENSINGITMSIDTLIKIRTIPLIENLTKSSEDIAVISSELRKFIDKTELTDGMAGAILGDTSITMDLKQTMENLNEGTQNFNESMDALKHHWLFRKFFKNK